jgi:hypothetical protein
MQWFDFSFLKFGVFDILDVLLVAFIIYQLIQPHQGHHCGQYIHWFNYHLPVIYGVKGITYAVAYRYPEEVC